MPAMHMRLMLALAIALLANGPAAADTPEQLYRGSPGDRARPIAGYDMQSRSTVALDDYAGKWVLLDFWASWCGPCLDDLPGLLAAVEPYQASAKLVVVSVSLDEPETLPALRRLIRRNGIRYPVLHDGLGFDSPLAREFNVSGIPHAVLIDPQGVIVCTGISGEDLAATLDYFITAPAPRPVVALRHWATPQADGSFTIAISARNTGHAPLEVKLHRIRTVWSAGASCRERRRTIPGSWAMRSGRPRRIRYPAGARVFRRASCFPLAAASSRRILPLWRRAAARRFPQWVSTRHRGAKGAPPFQAALPGTRDIGPRVQPGGSPALPFQRFPACLQPCFRK